MGKRRHAGHDEGGAHGGSWKIALADLMTVLMVFFLVMWLTSIVDPEKREAFVDNVLGKGEKVAIDEESVVKIAPVETMDFKPPISSDEIRNSMSTVNPADIDIQETRDEIVITLRSDSFFESGRANINDRTRESLENLGESLIGRGQKIEITGYTDNLPINNFQFPSNWELSAARAGTVARTFIYMGVDERLISIVGKAANDSIAPNDTAYGRSLNRRVIIKIDKKRVES